MSSRPSNQTRSSRLSHWAAFLVFSTITLGSVVEVVKDNKENNGESTSSERWSVACSAITFSITAIVVMMHMNPVSSLLIVGTKVEGALCVMLTAFWIATVSVVTDSRRGLAVDKDGAVDNGNVYYFSWAGFVCSITLLVSFLRDAFGVDIAGEIRTRSARLTGWAAHLACSLVVMGSSANYFDNSCGGNEYDEKKCGRAVYGIVLGAIATLFAVGIVSMKIATSKAPFLAEAFLSLVLVVMYGFGVAFITSQEGPGAPLGNLYYFSWLGFLSSFILLASCFEDYNAARAMTENEHRENSNDEGGVAVGEDQI